MTFKVGDKVRAKLRQTPGDFRSMVVRGGNATVVYVGIISPTLDVVFEGDAAAVGVSVHDTIMGWDEPVVETPILAAVREMYRSDPAIQKRDALLALMFGHTPPVAVAAVVSEPRGKDLVGRYFRANGRVWYILGFYREDDQHPYGGTSKVSLDGFYCENAAGDYKWFYTSEGQISGVVWVKGFAG